MIDQQKLKQDIDRLLDLIEETQNRELKHQMLMLYTQNMINEVLAQLTLRMKGKGQHDTAK